MARRGGGDAGGSDSPGHLPNRPGQAALALCAPRRTVAWIAPKRLWRLPRWSGSRSGGSHSRLRKGVVEVYLNTRGALCE